MLKARKNLMIYSVVVLILCAFSKLGWASSLELTVEQAIELTLEQNLSFRVVTLDWEQAQASLRRAQIVGEESMLSDAEKEWEKAQKNYLEQRQYYSSLVRSSYQDLLESEENIANWHKATERANDQLKIDQSKFAAGLLSVLDIERAENSLFSAQHSLENAIVNLKTKRMEFNQLLGLDFNQAVVLTERILLDFVPFTLELEECYQLALALDNSILGALENLAKAEEAVLVAQSPFTPKVELEKALVAQEKAQIQLKQAEQALYFRIRSEYYGLLNRIHNLAVNERTIKLEAQTLLAEESKYAVGILSNAQIVAQQEKLAQLEQDYSNELLQYNLTRQKFIQTIGLEESFRGEGNGS